MKTKCDFCSKELILSNYYFNHSVNHFCDSTCHSQWRLRNQHKIICDCCGATIYRNDYRLSKHKHNFCNKSCHNIWTSKNSILTNANAWKGGRFVTLYGYILIYMPSHPKCTNRGYISEHRLVMEQKIGRYLTKDDIVHHLNGVRDDNRPENLDICNKSTHEHTTKDKLYIKRIKHLEEQLKEYELASLLREKAFNG